MILRAIFLTGFAAIVSQIVFMREFLVVFYGNEISIAFILAAWLSGGAIGSAGFGRSADRIGKPRTVFALCLLILGVALPAIILSIRAVKPVININPGEILPFFPMVSTAFVILLPVSALLGFMFALGCVLYKGSADPGAARIGRAYVVEACGAIAGGLILSFWILRTLGSVQIIAGLSVILAGAAVLLLVRADRSMSTRVLRAAAAAFCAGAIVAMPLGVWERFDRYASRLEWKNLQLVASQDSIYGNVAITRNVSQYSFFDNGLHLYTVPDVQASEEAVHFAMLQHPDPKSVLLIGGGPGGLLDELLKHPVDRVDYVELDPLIIRMARVYLPNEYRAGLDDTRVTLRFGDGRLYLKDRPDTYDVIIINLGDPYTAQLNRFYTLEFFGEAKRALRTGGLISFGLSASESYMSKELRAFLGSIYATLSGVFADVKVIPGETAYFIASGEPGSLTYDQAVFAARTSRRGLDLKFVRDYYLSSRLSKENVAFTERSIALSAAGSALNRDLRPISYYYDMVFWAARFKDSVFTVIFRSLSSGIVLGVSALAVLALILSGIPAVRSGKRPERAALTAVFVNGFSQMSFQVVILLAFQILYGYMFYKISFIITAFMAGLAAGGALSVKDMARGGGRPRQLMLVQVCLCAFPVVMLAAFGILSGARSAVAIWIGANAVFAVLPFVSGCMGGYLFPLANRIFLGEGAAVGRSGGLNYGLDLMGACIGALSVGTFLIPIAGIPATCFVVAALNAAALTVTAVS